ncbi:serine/threonine protein kinase [Micromonospora sp. CPCC 205371]|nr:serine/threonine protein kinase [Micromonospora sp. CPCC 205371]
MADRIVGERYRLEKRLGRGGTATVWRGVDLDTGDRVAVKVLDPEQAARPVVVERLRREAQTVAHLDHPNIVASHAAGVDDDGGFLAMELVDGPTVADLLTVHGQLPVERAVAIAEQVSDALAAAHAAGVIHRDIKPGNLLVDGAGVVKVCDFGIARLQVRDGSALTSHSETVGTCEYMAPEQATGEPVDARTDLYALGCVLHAMLTGRPPFLGETAMAVLHQHLERAPVPVRALRSDVPAELDHLIGRLLAKSQGDRPATATEVRDALAAIRAMPGADAATVVLPRTPPRPIGRHRMRVALPVWMSSAAMSLRQYWIAMVSAAAILATVVTVAVVVAGEEPSGTPAAAPVPGPATVTAQARLEPSDVPPTPAASPKATPSAPAGRAPAATPMERVAALASLIERQIDKGELDPVAGRDLLRQVDRASDWLKGGRDSKAVERLHEVDARLGELLRDGKVSRTGFNALNIVDSIIAAIT